MEFKNNPKPGVCHVRYCSNNTGTRQSGKPRKMCYKHETRRRKETDPVAYTFYKLRCNAGARGVPFELTLEDFREFCSTNDYMDKKGQQGEDATIDRIDPRIGYVMGNLQVLQRAENSRKKYVDYYKYQEEDVPF